MFSCLEKEEEELIIIVIIIICKVLTLQLKALNTHSITHINVHRDRKRYQQLKTKQKKSLLSVGSFFFPLCFLFQLHWKIKKELKDKVTKDYRPSQLFTVKGFTATINIMNFLVYTFAARFELCLF